MSGSNTQIHHGALQQARRQSSEVVDRSTQRARTQMAEAESSTSFWKGSANAGATAAAQRMNDSYQKLVRAADEYHASIGKADSTFSNAESDSTHQFTKLT